jgi:hypothetical protein
MNIDIENPAAVINSLQRHIETLESLLRTTHEQLAWAESMDYVQTAKSLRLFSVLPLYIGDGGQDQLSQLLEKNSPERVHLLDTIWCLEDAPISISGDVKHYLRKLNETVNGGVDHG